MTDETSPLPTTVIPTPVPEVAAAPVAAVAVAVAETPAPVATAATVATDNPIVDGLELFASTKTDIETAAHAPTVGDKIVDAVEALGDTAEGAFSLLGELHVINAKLSNNGSSIAALLGAFAKQFAGIHF